MNRRAFLSTLAAGIAGLAIDPELLTWRKGAKSIFLPPAPSLIAPIGLTRGDVFTIEGVYAINPRTYRQTEYLQQFVITDDVVAGVSVVSALHPTMRAEGEYQNVSRLPFQNARVQPFQPFNEIRPEYAGQNRGQA